ncbi:MAG: hypothetical protein HY903_14015 [Deltaproteobacteria bacterium]|nr:hypothetical protein [Deltaproteobacteria bacterium]
MLAATMSAASGSGISTGGALGFLNQPEARALMPGRFAIVSELAFDYDQFGRTGPGALSVGVGLPPSAELTVSLRETGLTRDRLGANAAQRLGLKVSLLDAGPRSPTLAVDAYADHLGDTVQGGGRLLVSRGVTEGGNAGILAGIHSGRAGAGFGPEAGLAFALALGKSMDLLSEASIEGAHPWAVLTLVGVRYHVTDIVQLTVRGAYRPVGREAVRVSVALSVSPRLFVRRAAGEAGPAAPAHTVTFSDARPRFRLVVPVRRLPGEPGVDILAPEGWGEADEAPSADGELPWEADLKDMPPQAPHVSAPPLPDGVRPVTPGDAAPGAAPKQELIESAPPEAPAPAAPESPAPPAAASEAPAPTTPAAPEGPQGGTP